ncbi:hypothetical protein L7F22_041013 [Adiantum nelumboides]|nr:hypothetical protein [Adiantum nelumboides]
MHGFLEVLADGETTFLLAVLVVSRLPSKFSCVLLDLLRHVAAGGSGCYMVAAQEIWLQENGDRRIRQGDKVAAQRWRVLGGRFAITVLPVQPETEEEEAGCQSRSSCCGPGAFAFELDGARCRLELHAQRLVMSWTELGNYVAEMAYLQVGAAPSNMPSSGMPVDLNNAWMDECDMVPSSMQPFNSQADGNHDN